MSNENYVCQKCGSDSNLVRLTNTVHIIGFLCTQCNLDYQLINADYTSELVKGELLRFKRFVSGAEETK